MINALSVAAWIKTLCNVDNFGDKGKEISVWCLTQAGNGAWTKVKPSWKAQLKQKKNQVHGYILKHRDLGIL